MPHKTSLILSKCLIPPLQIDPYIVPYSVPYSVPYEYILILPYGCKAFLILSKCLILALNTVLIVPYLTAVK